MYFSYHGLTKTVFCCFVRLLNSIHQFLGL
nr:MAG TPA: hypothetical protein [Caudoviricetes sp.]